ncbi:glycoside hydrolase family 65 protein [Levilactobacillus spicheri]
MTTRDYHLTLKDVGGHQPEYLETIFSLANGHFGVRANDPISGNPISGTLINGFYETAPITYGEGGFGYAKLHQTIVNLADLRHLSISTLNGHPFTTSKRLAADLNLNTGVLTEQYQASSQQGETIQLTVESVIGQNRDSFWAIRYTLAADNYAGPLVVSKSIAVPAAAEEIASADPRKTRMAGIPDCKTDFTAPNTQRYQIQTKASQLAVTLHLQMATPGGSLLNYRVDLSDGQPHALDYQAYVGVVSRHNTIDPIVPVLAASLEELEDDNREFWGKIWRHSEVSVGGNPELDLAIHYNIFQLNQSAGRDGRTDIPAKGLSGSGYEGHYFWDTEMYMLPYFIYTHPQMARQLLQYRYQVLPQARDRAREMGVAHGALFAWRTINGEEASAYYPAGTAQYHIDADIAYAVGKYYDVTGDWDFISQCGFEMVLETARFWVDFGAWHQLDAKTKRFEFLTVTGPDEYTALVNNNYYTNRMAKHNLELVVKLAAELAKHDPNRLMAFNVTPADLEHFQDIADHIYLPYSQQYQIIAQDDSFLSKPRWPEDRMAPDNFPLLLHYHPLTIYRYQIAKQADTMLADYLFPRDLTHDQLEREYDYYEQVTTHDSSLSRSIFSILAARLGDTEKAYRYFMDTARMDLVDLQKNTADGLHLANLGGSWLALVAGFSGFYVDHGVVHISNHLPQELTALTYRLTVGKSVLQVDLKPDETHVQLISGPSVHIDVNGQAEMLMAVTAPTD